MSKQLWLLCGGNGAGKSTFYDLFLKPRGLPFVNADLIARELFPDNPAANSYAAARLADGLREDMLLNGTSFCFETVFSHPAKIDFLARAKALGYTIVLVFIHLEPATLNVARVAQRVSAGGHAVPEDKIRSRLPRTLRHVRAAIPLCDQVRVLDNSLASQPYRPILTLRAGQPTCHVTPLPAWADALLAH